MSWWEHSPFAVIPGATAAALLAGALLPPLGLWLVLQRVVFLGVALAQVAAAGVALGLLLHLPALPLGLLTCALMVGGLARRLRGGIGAGGDSALGAAFCLASALALLFISRSPADLDQVGHVLHGNLIFATWGDVGRMGSALVGGTLLIALVFPRLLFCAFDGETAAALGLAVRGWLLLLFGVLAVVLTLSMRTTGALLTFALLVLPALAALQLRRGLRASFVLAALLGLLGAAAGLLLAVRADLHLESAIVVTSFLTIPFARAWRTSPLLAAGFAGALVALAPLLSPEHVSPPGARHVHEPEPFHFDVHLDASRVAPDRLAIGWTLDVHRDDPEASLPMALWLVVTRDGRSSAHVLVPDTAVIAPGESFVDGRFEIDAAPGALRVEGQLWSGPPDALDALPVGEATVIGADVR